MKKTNYLINFASKVGIDTFGRLLSLVTIPIIAPILGPEGYGDFSYAVTITAYFGIFIDFNYSLIGTNNICQGENENIVVNQLFSIKLFTAMISWLLLIIIGYFAFSKTLYSYLIILSVGYFVLPFNIDYFFIAKNKLYFVSIAQLTAQLIYVLLVLFVFRYTKSITSLLWFTVILSFVNYMILFLKYLNKHKLQININIQKIKKTFLQSIKLGVSGKLEKVTTTITILLIGILLSSYSVGIYNIAFKVYSFLLAVIIGFQQTLLPIILKKKAQGDNIHLLSVLFYMYFLFGIILGLVSFFLAPTFITLLVGNKFVDSIPIIKRLSLSLFIWPLLMFLQTILIRFGKQKYYLISTIINAITSTIFSFSFTILFGVNGSAFVFFFVAIIGIIVCLVMLKKVFNRINENFLNLFSVRIALNYIYKK